MSIGIAADAANEILDMYFGAVALEASLPASWYVGLFTAMPAADGSGGTEASAGSYARLAVTRDQTNFPAAADGEISNGTDLTWSDFGADLGEIVGLGIFDAATDGNLKAMATAGTAITVSNGQGYSIAAGQLTFSLVSAE